MPEALLFVTVLALAQILPLVDDMAPCNLTNSCASATGWETPAFSAVNF